MLGKRVLIVDDDKNVARMFRASLEQLEHQLEIEDVFSGEEALLIMRQHPIDLLIADVRLPGITGLELMTKFVSRNPGGKIILVSGVSDPRIRSQVANAGADGFFFKPVDIADFLDAVERSLGFVESFLPPELTLHVEDLNDPVEEDDSSMGINQHIADLRVSLNATAVLLVTIDGKVLARAGDLPDPELEISLMPVLMRAFNAGVHISNFLGQNIPDHFYSYRGENYDLFLAPAGDSHCLLVLTKPTLPQEIGNIISLVQGTARSVFLNLARLKIIQQEEEFPKVLPSEEPAAAPDVPAISQEGGELDSSLEELLEDAEQAQPQDADAFWAAAAGEDIKPELTSADSLSYDQAAKLGLAPSDDE